jgi:C-terminal processing protease CtpA/Prc
LRKNRQRSISHTESFDGERQIKRQLSTTEKRLPSGKPKLGESRILNPTIGYLRIPAMSNSGIDDIVATMAMFRHTDGLIIDRRGNSGGYYGILCMAIF